LDYEKLSPSDKGKMAAAQRACDYVEDGMYVGLGTGSTAAFMVRRLAERIRDEGLRITGVATSTRTADLAKELGIPIISLNEAKWLDVTIDGADEFDPDLSLIKGGGGALLQEKIVAAASDMMVVITDPSKDVQRLGAFPLPVEVVRFGWQTSRALIGELLATLDVDGRAVTLRRDGDEPFETDEGNFILDLELGRIGKPRQLALVLNQIPGVVENGLFVDICDRIVVGHPDGTSEVREFHGQRPAGAVQITENLFASIAE
jgi:ribose 5-phosphate isomerase A